MWWLMNALYIAADLGLLAASTLLYRLRRDRVSLALLATAAISAVATLATRALEYWLAGRIESLRDIPHESVNEANTALSQHYFNCLGPLLWTKSVASLLFALLLGWIAYKMLAERGVQQDAT